LVATLNEHSQIGMISPKIKYFDEPERIQYAGYTPMNYFTARNSCIGLYEVDNGQFNQVVAKTGYIHGAAMMVRKEAIEKAGLMSENFFLYFEEYDWCDRIQQNGYSIWVNLNACIYHKESVSVGKNSALKEYFMNRNRILFIRRNAAFYQKLFFYVYFLALVVPRNIITYIKNGDPNFIKQLFKAIWWNCTNSVNSTYLGFPLKK
ncbi:MAG: glycosyltransferase family 2 protein, partial [Chitinophagaceae bacterium]